MLSSQEIGSSLVSFWMILEALQSELFSFIHWIRKSWKSWETTYIKIHPQTKKKQLPESMQSSFPSPHFESTKDCQSFWAWWTFEIVFAKSSVFIRMIFLSQKCHDVSKAVNSTGKFKKTVNMLTNVSLIIAKQENDYSNWPQITIKMTLGTTLCR